MYEQVALISPTGKIPSKSLKIPGDITSMDVPLPAGEVNLRKDFSGMSPQERKEKFSAP